MEGFLIVGGAGMPIPAPQWIWFNGKFIPWGEANVHVSTHALHYGSSVFEGMRAYPTPSGPAIVALDRHVQRLFESCRLTRMDMPFTFEEIRQAILELVRRNGHSDCYIRPLVFRGAESFELDGRACPTQMAIISFEWGRYLGEDAVDEGVDAMVSSWRRMAPDTFMALSKAGGNYLNSQLIIMEAKDNGFAEGIALDVQGFVSEGSGENIFVVRRGVIHTPPVSASALMGITREYTITLARELGYEVIEQMLPREMLYLADEIFLTGTAVEITPVRSVDRTVIGSGRRGPVTKSLQDEFFGILFGKLPDRHGWLTLVGKD
jgi:branched-chain amino acid aminotransferase